MSLVAKAFVIDEVSRKLFVLKPIGEFHDLMNGTISSPKHYYIHQNLLENQYELQNLGHL